jgi:hypothetical protein
VTAQAGTTNAKVKIKIKVKVKVKVKSEYRRRFALPAPRSARQHTGTRRTPASKEQPTPPTKTAAQAKRQASEEQDPARTETPGTGQQATNRRANLG